MDSDALLVAALGAAVLTGCTPSAPVPSPSVSPSVPPSADPDVAVVSAWAVEERSLAARYGPLAARVPALAPLRANHLARAAACEALLSARGAVVPHATGRPSNGAPRALMAAFATVERRLAARYLTDVALVRDADVAVLGAELAAGARQHALALSVVRVP